MKEITLKVIRADEMARIEKLAYAAGAKEVDFMENAGVALAEITEEFILCNDLAPVVTLLVGKGNNGGDAYVAGRYLIERGFTVEAYPIYPLEDSSPLCRQMYELYRQKGGITHLPVDRQPFQFDPQGVILDGLVGTGFHGKAEGVLAQAIVAANGSGLPIIAIDIPSGVNGNTGEVETVGIHADVTVYLGLPKLGFFIGEGWNYVGELAHASFGLEERFIGEAKAEGYLLASDALSDLLPPMHRTRNKYEAGYVLGVAGSLAMPGAALLASYAALRTGAGIVRLFYPEEMHSSLRSAPYELICESWKNEERILAEMQRAKALFVGPGIGRSKETSQKLKSLLAQLTIPCVLDADALFFLGESPSLKLPDDSVLTPHHGEMRHLLSSKDSQYTWADCQRYAENKKVTLVLKGAPTVVFHPGQKPIIVAGGDPGMATAGSGDVLTGMIAALIAQGMDPLSGAVLAVALHAKAGEIAASELTSYCMVASDLIDYLPEALGS